MTNTPIQVTTDLTTVLERIEAKFDRFEQKLDKIDEKFERKFQEVEQKIDKLDEKFEQKFQEVEQKIDKLDEKFEQKSQATAISLARLEESQKGLSNQITELSSKVNNLEGRVNVQVNWFLGIITVLVGALVTALSKFVFFPTNNL